MAYVEEFKRDKAILIEAGPRAFACSIPENSTPFILPLIWRYQQEQFDQVQGYEFGTTLAQMKERS